MGPIPSQPLDFVGSRFERASNTSESENLEVQIHDEGREKVLVLGIEKELLVKTEWKKVFTSSTFPVSEVALRLSRTTIEGIVLA